MEASPSQIRDYELCPRYWAEGSKGPSGPEAIVGKVCHSACEKSTLAALAGEDKTPMSFVPSDIDQALREKALDLLSRYQAHEEFHVDASKVLSVEASDSEHIHPMLGKKIYRTKIGEHTLTGIPDRISLLNDNALLVDDYKFGMAIPSDPIQLGCYAVAASEQYGIKRVKARFIFPAIGIAPNYWYEESDLEAVKVRVCGIMDSMAKAQAPYAERVNVKCIRCSARDKCSEYAKVLAGQLPPPPPEVTDVLQANALREIYSGAEKIHAEAADRLQDLQETLLGADGKVVNGELWTCKKIPMRYKYPTAKFVEILKEYGLLAYLAELVDIASGNVTRFLKDNHIKEKLGAERHDKLVASINDIKSVSSTRRQFSRKPVGEQA